ncbi:LysR substrate-binding domain-containing protein [Rhodococcus opacus]|uniref:Putative LysR family transcriptional regulator n=1 Tax=Rhodococcus opacus (strain B4) TaxID=632772 RepID=C1AV98_RHOOB|nr:LysR substrate-binding domain-containing protein [Rhodococcus opacus]BAH53588.1 putative LysR family transcriptional regulator [Rhodococcus opacus B4]
MELRHLRYFVAVAEERHFGRAAERLHVVQPTLSMQVRALEKELGGPLFVRTSRRVELTEAGTAFLVEARRALAQAEWAKTTAQRSMRGEIGSVRVGFAGVAVLIGKLGRDLEIFHERYPQSRIEVRELVPRAQGEAILAGELDVGYSPGFGAVTHPDLRADRIGTSPLVVAMSDRHRLADRRTVPIRDLGEELLLVYSAGGEDDSTVGDLREQLGGHPPDRVRHLPSTLSVLAMASAGLGVALVPAQTANIAIPGLAFRPLAESGVVAELLVLSRGEETSGAARALLAIALSVIE